MYRTPFSLDARELLNRAGDVHASMPRSRAIVRARSEWSGSVTITADFRSRFFIASAPALRLSWVSWPFGTAITADAGTPFFVSHVLPVEASVKLSPG